MKTCEAAYCHYPIKEATAYGIALNLCEFHLEVCRSEFCANRATRDEYLVMSRQRGIAPMPKWR